jgi:hypothetical protein
MIKKIAIAIVVLIVAVLAYAATKPDTFTIQRTATIDAPPERIFPFINDLHSFGSWSPYEKRDPAMKRTYSGPPFGKGAIYAWDGNSDVGQGSMEIVDSTPSSEVRMKLDFIRPFEGHNTVVFTLVPQGQSTNVTWAMHGENPYMSKVLGTFINFDKMVGGDFQTGLANLKTLAEAPPAKTNVGA